MEAIWTVILALVCVSIFIELMRYIKSVGMTEVDDVLHNTLGAVFGYLAGMLALKINERVFARKRK